MGLCEAVDTNDGSGVCAELNFAEKFIHEGDLYCINEEFDLAVDSFAMGEVNLTSVSALWQSTKRYSIDKFRIYSHRSFAFLQLQQYEDAYCDALNATILLSSDILCIGKSQMSEKKSEIEANSESNSSNSDLMKGEVESCWRRYAMASYQLEKFDKALMGFQNALQLSQLNNILRNGTKSESTDSKASKRSCHRYEEWILKCQEKINQETIKTLDKGEGNIPAVEGVSAWKKTNVQAAPMTSITTADITSGTTTLPQSQHSLEQTTSSDISATSTRTVDSSMYTIPKYQYFQNDKFMTIVILESNLTSERLNVELNKKSLTVTIARPKLPGQVSSSAAVICGTLYDEIDVEQSKTSYKPEKALIKLKKRKAFEWHQLLSKDTTFSRNAELKKRAKELQEQCDSAAKSTSPVATNAVVPLVRSSPIPRPYASHRDWNTIGRNIEAEEAAEQPVGDEAMNKLFQQLFQDADDDTRRAMIKSYQTSGGTVLSTNWNEVRDTDYEKDRTAPKGMEWKTWEGKKLPMKDD